MIKKHREKIVLFLSYFIVTFILGLFFNYYLNTAKYWNV